MALAVASGDETTLGMLFGVTLDLRRARGDRWRRGADVRRCGVRRRAGRRGAPLGTAVPST